MTEQSKKRVAEGRALAKVYCSSCHAIGTLDKGRHDETPPFRVIHHRHPVLALSTPLRRSIAYPHDAMPKFRLTDAQVDTLVAYINSIQTGR